MIREARDWVLDAGPVREVPPQPVRPQLPDDLRVYSLTGEKTLPQMIDGGAVKFVGGPQGPEVCFCNNARRHPPGVTTVWVIFH